MKNAFALLLLVVIACSFALPAGAEEMRRLPAQARQARDILAQKAAEERAAAQKMAAESRARILADRKALTQSVAALEAEVTSLEAEIGALEERDGLLLAEEQALDAELGESEAVVRELLGQIRISAKDLDTLLRQSPQAALEGRGADFFAAVAEQERFPGMDDIASMSQALLDVIQWASQVSLRQGRIVDRRGLESKANVLFVGPFTSIYHQQDETGFLVLGSGGGLSALSRLPDAATRRNLERYLGGEDEAVPVDISRGGALRQLSHQLSLSDQIQAGGPIVWPILTILLVGILIVFERVLRLLRSRTNGAEMIEIIRPLARKGEWQTAENVCLNQGKKPLARVLLAGLGSRQLSREDLENVLHEAILKEIPSLERFLSTLGMLVAIAPLLGLLGTVTGMINVFHVITLQGTGDPRLMSGGISEALVTTMLGLSVAIPLMLLHNMLSRGVDRLIGDMEEQAVALVNIVHRYEA